MKNYFFGSAVAAALVFGLAACTPIQQTTSDSGYYEVPPTASTPTRIWVDDPYRPGASILMERDPFTGRYFPVSSNSAYGGYGSTYNTSPYGTYRDPNYRGSRPRRNSNVRNYPTPQQPSPQQQEQYRRNEAQKRQQAADAILGRKQ
jgi:hypothetical protein